MRTHDFNACLSGSMGIRRDLATRSELREYFGNPKDFVCNYAPRLTAYGHDIDVVAWGRRYKIEEKRRERDYSDELLEDVSNSRTGRKGWTWRAAEVDYVIFTFPTQPMHIWPGSKLQLAWERNRDDWIMRYVVKRARNHSYDTINVIVPTEELAAAIRRVGAPTCVHCERPVGVFHVKCQRCRAVTCCAISEEGWTCSACCYELGE